MAASMPEHTPSPWQIEEFMDGCHSVSAHEGVEDVALEIVRIEDARLIAAAPDLLAALRDVTWRLHHCIVGVDSEPDYVDSAVLNARRAIAKATGAQ